MTEEQFLLTVQILDSGSTRTPNETSWHAQWSTRFLSIASTGILDLDPGTEYGAGYPYRRFWRVTGTTTIAGISVADLNGPNGIVWMFFESACPLVHSADFQLVGSTNFTTSPGDLLAFRKNGAGTGDKWKHLFTVSDFDYLKLIQMSGKSIRDVTAQSVTMLPGYGSEPNLYSVTGEDAITAIPNAIKTGQAWLIFPEGGTLVHSTQLNMPGAANFEAVAGQVVVLKPSKSDRNHWVYIASFANSGVNLLGSTAALFDAGGSSGPGISGYIPPQWATQAEAEAGTANDKLMTPLRTAQAIAAHTDDTITFNNWLF